MKDFLNAGWEPIFEQNGLRTFDDFWNLKAAWFEVPNQRRGGWSGVARCELTLPGGGRRAIFLKRQVNHVTKTWRHPLRGLLTLVKEFRNIMFYRRCGIGSLVPLYFACRLQNGQQRAVLITEELTGFRPMSSVEHEWRQASPGLATRRAVIQSVAALLRRIHDHGLRHNCFYPKHVFLRIGPGAQAESRVIDLESALWRPFGLNRGWRDLDSLNRHAHGWTRSERLRFFLSYWQASRLTPELKERWRTLAGRLARKHPNLFARLNRAPAAFPVEPESPAESTQVPVVIPGHREDPVAATRAHFRSPSSSDSRRIAP